MVLKLVSEDDPILKEPTDPFDFSVTSFDVSYLVESMTTVMREFNGMGLAAPQVGLPFRMFIMQPADSEQIIACFNPEILATSDDIVKGAEGCLSFPDLWLDVDRPSWIEVRYQNAEGIFVNEKFADMNARCYAHEYDHVNGVRFTTRVSRLVLTRAKTRRSKKVKGAN
jgi:peptide deformylase